MGGRQRLASLRPSRQPRIGGPRSFGGFFVLLVFPLPPQRSLLKERADQHNIQSLLRPYSNNQKQIMTVTSNTRKSAIFVEEAHNLDGDIVKMSKETSTKGRNVSGRSWKVRPQKRSSSLVKTKINNQSKPWEVREEERLAKKEIRELQTQMREDRRQGKIVKKERRLENEKRRAENEFKSSQKSAKSLNINKLGNTLKAMSKKQLRQVKKTRVNPKTGLVEYVSAYSK
jgi:hypothetical protein